MKRIVKSFAIAAVSALAFISCLQEQNPVSQENGIHFTIRTSENPQVKSFIENTLEGKYIPKWSKGDELAMFVGTITENTTKATGILKNVNETNEVAKFDGMVTGLPTDGSFKSFSPAKAFATGYSTGNVGINLATEQKPSSITIDEACDILVAKETSYMADATGEVTIDDLFFKRIFSVVKIALNGPVSLNGEKVSKFSLTAPEGTALTGCAAIDLTTATIDKWDIGNNSVTATYEADAPVFGGASGLENEVWLVVNPGTIASGAKLVFAGETSDYTFSKEVTLSKALTFPESQLAVINLTLTEENCTKKATPAAASWIATDLADITAADEVVITMAKGESVYALTSAKGTKDAPTAVSVTIENKELAKAPTEDLVWNIANNNGNLTIYPKGQTDNWLYTTNNNNGVRVGTNNNKTFVVDSESGYLKNTATNRYLGVYNNADWRCYKSAPKTSNIADQTLCFYVKGTPKTALETPANLQVSAAKVVSWDAVSGAASYNVIIGTETYTSNTNSYDATAITDDYYNVDVVAVPSDKENYKNSSAATLTGAKFGTPKFTTPELAEGAIDESSIGVNMTVDARATNGCTCEIYKGETLVESKTITASYVVFNGLEDGVTYTIKVNAIAVEGEKPYAASDVASIKLTTKAAQHVSDVTEAGTYTIKGLTVYAVPNPSNAIVGDGTGFILLYKSSHGLNVGDTFNVAGTVKPFNGVWEFENPSITGQAAGETPVYPEAVEADDAYLTSYGTTTKIEYVHAMGIQSGKNIKVGTKTLYLSAENPETDGKNVEVTGFVYGYNTRFSSASFVATSIQLDDSFPYLSVDQSSKVWAADATDAFVVKVTVNAKADWTVTPETLSWATIAVDKTAGTITVTPNGANTAQAANEAKLTVAHASEASLTKEITLKQNAAGGATGLVEYVSTFTDNKLNTKEKTMTWTSSIEANSFEARGVQFGAKKGQFTITGTGHTSNVKKISIIISTNYAGNTISATVGGVAIGKQISLTKANNYEIVFESTTELSGDIVFNVNDKDKSVYIKSITVNPAN